MNRLFKTRARPTAPADEVSHTAVATEQKQVDLAVASQWRMIGVRFRRHKLAMAGLVTLFVLYFAALFCEMIAPFAPDTRNADYVRLNPQKIRFFDHEGNFHWRPFVYDVELKQDGDEWQRDYTIDTSSRHPVRFLARGEPYKLWNLIEWDRHLITSDGPMFLFGTDDLGRDLLSRILYGARISLSIGLVGVAFSFLIGIILGGLAGYYGGWVDMVVQRKVEILMCIPQLPLWMGLSAAMPAYWPALWVYFGITLILSLMGWTGLAREVRGKFLSLRDQEFVVAARLSGTGEMKIIFKHLLPSFLSHVITAATLAIPAMILGETALSFLGIGLRPPVVSWGVLLQDAQNFSTVVMAPWLLLPGAFVIIAVLAFNVVGDGMRDAADPYSKSLN